MYDMIRGMISKTLEGLGVGIKGVCDLDDRPRS